MTIKSALDQKRQQLQGKVAALVLCKRELFYLPSPGNSPNDSVYPVSLRMAEKEAAFFGVSLQQE